VDCFFVQLSNEKARLVVPVTAVLFQRKDLHPSKVKNKSGCCSLPYISSGNVYLVTVNASICNERFLYLLVHVRDSGCCSVPSKASALFIQVRPVYGFCSVPSKAFVCVNTGKERCLLLYFR
jgi:hypothetical protein